MKKSLTFVEDNMARPNYNLSNTTNSVNGMSFYRMSDAPPDWTQNDPSQPDYIAGREQAELPVLVDGEEFTQETEGYVEPLEFRSGDNVKLVPTTEVDENGNKKHVVTINAKTSEGGVSEVRPIEVNDDRLDSNTVNFKAGNAVSLFHEVDEDGENVITISASLPDIEESSYTAGEGIEIGEEMVDGKYAISLKDDAITAEKIMDGAITADKIASVDFSSIQFSDETLIILNGGKAK